MAKSDKKYRVGKSKIQGDGAFAKQTLNPGDYIGKVHTINKLYEDYDFTELGKKHNHSEDPNVQNVLIGNERHLIAIKPIKKGQELTSDYRLQPDLEQPNQDFEKAKNGGWLDAYDAPQAQNGIEGTMGGLTDKGFNFNPAWGGAWQNGGKKPRISRIDPRKDKDYENIFEIIDPTGFSSYDDIYRSYKETGFSPKTAVEVFGAIPLLGKLTKLGKLVESAAKTFAVTGRQKTNAKAAGKVLNAVGRFGPGAGRSTDAYQAYDEWQNGGILQPPMAGAVQTVPMAQNGSNIGTRPEDEDIREIYKWEKEYTNSPRFAYLSSKQGDSPEITQRRRDIINKFNIDEDIVRVPDGVSYVGDEGDGLKFYLSPDAGDWPSYSDINAHEIGHFPYNTGELNFPESTYNEIQARNKEFQKMKASGITNDDVEHDVSPNEVRADKNQLLYQMKKLGIYDATKDGDVTPEQLDKFKKSGQWNRLQRLYNDDDILWLINNVAQNTSGVSDKAFMGASIPGSTGFTYARTQGAAPSEGPYAKKTMPSAQDGELLTFEREEPFRPTSVEEPSALLSMDYLKSFVPEYKRLTGVPNRANDMYDRMYTDLVHKKGMDPMKGAYITSFLQENYDPFGNLKRYRPTTPETDYTDEERMESRRREKEAAERNKKVAGKLGEDYLKNGGMAYYQAGLDFKPKTISRDGSSVNRADENPLQKLDDLLNFTNYNKPKAKSGGWLDKYN